MTGSARGYELKNAGDTGLVVEFGERVDREVSARVVALAEGLRALEAPGVLELVPTFRSLLIRYEPVVISAAELDALVARALSADTPSARPRRRWTIAACFDEACGPDADLLAEFAGVARRQVQEMLAGMNFHVHMLGFLPGQPYLGDLPDSFDIPRRSSPRTSVPAGAIGIAKRLVCIYPAETPCGWHIVGRTAARLWDEGPLLQAGDEVRLLPVPLSHLETPAAACPTFEEALS